MDVRVINEMVQQQSAFVDNLTAEVGKVIVGQKAMVERLLIACSPGGMCCWRAFRVWPDPDGQDPGRLARHALPAHPIHARLLPPHRGHGHLQQNRGEFVSKKGPIFANAGAGRRNQPRACKVQSGTAGGHAGTPGHVGDETHACPTPSCDGHAEPHRAGRTMPSRGALDRFMLMVKVGYPSKRTNAPSWTA